MQSCLTRRRSKRGWDNSPLEASTPPTHQGSFGGQSNDNYAYGAPAIKRQRSDSDYGNPQIFAPAQYQGSTMSQFNNNLHGLGHGWTEHYQESLSPEASAPMGSGTMSQNQPHSINVPIWQGRAQRGPLSAPAGGTGGMSYFSGVGRDSSASRSYFNSKYAQQQNQQHPLRSSDDTYPNLAGIQTTTSIPDSALSSHAQPNYPSHIGQQSQFHPTQHHQDAPNSAVQHDPRSVAIDTTGHPYHTSGHTTTNVGAYDHHPQSNTGQYGQGSYVPSQNLYPDPGRDSYPSNTGSLSNATLPLDSGVLNRDFSGPYPGEQ